MNPYDKFKITGKMKKHRVALVDSKGFYDTIFGNGIYYAGVIIGNDGKAQIVTEGSLMQYENSLEMFKQWNIIDRRLLIEKNGHTI